MPSRSRWAVLGVALVLVVGCAEVSPENESEPWADGPVVADASGLIVWTGPPFREGHYPSNGITVIENRSDRLAAVLSDVEPYGGDGRLLVHEAFVLPYMEDVMTFGGGFTVPSLFDGYLSTSQLYYWQVRRPVDGYLLRPGESVHLLVLYDSTDRCVGGTSDGIVLRYRIGGQLYQAGAPHGVDMRWEYSSWQEERPASCSRGRSRAFAGRRAAGSGPDGRGLGVRR